MPTNRVLGYCRVSSREQAHGTSLEAQQQEIERFCRDRSLPAPRLFIEVESGSGEATEARVEQTKLLALVADGDLVLVAKQDRWSRDTIHYLRTADEIAKRGARLTSIAEGLDVESPERRLAATQFASFAEYERRRIKERTVGGRRHLRAQGFHVEGQPPLGYKVEARRLVVVPEQAEVVRALFAWVIEGIPSREIGDKVRERWPWVAGADHSAITRRIHDPRYLGLASKVPIRPKGATNYRFDWANLVPNHEAIVDRSTWDAAQKMLKSRKCHRTGKETTSRFLLRGLIRCAHCDHVVHVQVPKVGASVRHAGWYFCAEVHTCPAPRARQDGVDVAAEQLTLAQLAKVSATLAKAAPKTMVERPKRDEVASIETKRKRIVDAIADGVIDLAVAKAKLDELASAEAAARAKVTERVQEERRADPEALAARLVTVRAMRDAWSVASVPDRREMLRLLGAKATLESTASKKWERNAWILAISWDE